MGRGHGMIVQESGNLVILIDDFSWSFSGDDLTKHAGFHDGLVFQSLQVRRRVLSILDDPEQPLAVAFRKQNRGDLVPKVV